MVKNNSNPTSNTETVFCINCGSEISVDTDFCPECGSSQDPSKVEADEESPEGSGFTTWAPGFKPSSTLRNIVIGVLYLGFFYIGVFVLIYGYLKENPESGSKFAWILGIVLILAGFGGFTEGTAQGIVGGVIAVLLGIVALPIVREKIGVGSPAPGIKKVNTARRNALISVGYGFGALVVAGAALPETESSASSNDTGGSTDNGDSSGGGSSGEEETYPSAFYYDESTGIVFENDIDAEVDSIGSVYIRGTARNESGQDYEYVQISWAILDSSGAKIADALANTSGLSDGQSWRYEALAPSADEIESYELQDITAY
jgi:hypothetical protein